MERRYLSFTIVNLNNDEVVVVVVPVVGKESIRRRFNELIKRNFRVVLITPEANFIEGKIIGPVEFLENIKWRIGFTEEEKEEIDYLIKSFKK